LGVVDVAGEPCDVGEQRRRRHALVIADAELIQVDQYVCVTALNVLQRERRLVRAHPRGARIRIPVDAETFQQIVEFLGFRGLNPINAISDADA